MADDPLADVRAHQEKYEAAMTAAENARDARDAAIVDAARRDTKQADIVREIGLSREQVRRICRAAGIESAR